MAQKRWGDVEKLEIGEKHWWRVGKTFYHCNDMKQNLQLFFKLLFQLLNKPDPLERVPLSLFGNSCSWIGKLLARDWTEHKFESNRLDGMFSFSAVEKNPPPCLVPAPDGEQSHIIWNAMSYANYLSISASHLLKLFFPR